MTLQTKHAAKLATALLTVAVVAFLGCFLAGCSTSSQEGVAATLYGEAITEDDVADYIASYREHNQLSDDSAWADYLSEQGSSAQVFREMTIDQLAAKKVYQHVAQDNGITADEDWVQQQIDALKQSMAGGDDSVWQDTLDMYGLSEDELHQNYELNSLREQVLAKEVPIPTPTDDEVAGYIKDNLVGTTVKNVEALRGARYLPMQRLLVKIQGSGNEGKTFENAKKKDVERNDVGWALGVTLGSDMQEYVDELKKGQVSEELYADGTYYQILYCADSYKFTKKSYKDGTIPSELLDKVKDLEAEELWSDDCDDWLRKAIDDVITINPAPSDLPYDVSE